MPSDPRSAARLQLIGNKEIRRILAALNVEPSSVKQLANSMDLSQATIYRRLKELDEHNLIKTRTFLADDGHHYHVYECNFRSATITLDWDEYTAYFNERVEE